MSRNLFFYLDLSTEWAEANRLCSSRSWDSPRFRGPPGLPPSPPPVAYWVPWMDRGAGNKWSRKKGGGSWVFWWVDLCSFAVFFLVGKFVGEWETFIWGKELKRACEGGLQEKYSCNVLLDIWLTWRFEFFGFWELIWLWRSFVAGTLPFLNVSLDSNPVDEVGANMFCLITSSEVREDRGLPSVARTPKSWYYCYWSYAATTEILWHKGQVCR